MPFEEAKYFVDTYVAEHTRYGPGLPQRSAAAYLLAQYHDDTPTPGKNTAIGLPEFEAAADNYIEALVAHASNVSRRRPTTYRLWRRSDTRLLRRTRIQSLSCGVLRRPITDARSLFEVPKIPGSIDPNDPGVPVAVLTAQGAVGSGFTARDELYIPGTCRTALSCTGGV